MYFYIHFISYLESIQYLNQNDVAHNSVKLLLHINLKVVTNVFC